MAGEPFARAQRWSAAKTARVTFLCGFGHVTVSALLGLLGLAFGSAVFESAGQKMEAVAGILLIGFGLAYGAWGLKRAAGRCVHGHVHSHYDHIHETSKMTAWSLFVLFSADPCVAVIPLLFAAAPLGTAPTVGIVLLYEAATRNDDRARSAGARRYLAAKVPVARPLGRRAGGRTHRRDRRRRDGARDLTGQRRGPISALRAA